MNTTSTATDTTSSNTDETKGFWLRRTVAPVGIAAGLALALALSACGTDQAVKRTSVDAETTTSSIVEDLAASAPSSDASSDSGAPASSGGSQSNDGGQSVANGSSDNAGNAQPGPVIDTFYAPDSVDCHNGNVQQFTVSWETSNTTKATISIDGPGIYAEYGPDDEASLPFTCTVGETQTVLLTAYGANGETATHTVTLGGRNIQGTEPDDEGESAMGVTARTGGSTGTGPLSDADCERTAKNLDNLETIAGDKAASGDTQGAAEAIDLASRLDQTATDLGCFFID